MSLAKSFVTKGGVDLKEINPKTLKARKSQASTLQARSWTSTPTPAALTLPTVWQLAGWQEFALLVLHQVQAKFA